MGPFFDTEVENISTLKKHVQFEAVDKLCFKCFHIFLSL